MEETKRDNELVKYYQEAYDEATLMLQLLRGAIEHDLREAPGEFAKNGELLHRMGKILRDAQQNQYEALMHLTNVEHGKSAYSDYAYDSTKLDENASKPDEACE